ncbi:hypothetical protein GPROT2_00036 [Gammaproteobacteria bacterium]|nr:lipid-binding SYLF domain-containing protein [Gammaproteobacteria bacterium]QOJ32098.1 MAG: lipid-binding SYLF domain-containing protein [Gammaproteobacteria bacterium]CAG0937871.1 hypothetical protein GPROT2_00036 [Gammaproteobacteria bacterium]
MTRLTAILLALACAAASSAATASELDYRVDTATQILQDLKRIPENAVPPALLSRAYAVAVIPGVLKGGFVLGGTYGRGIVVARRADGQWSNPAFVQLAGGSIGFQAGLQSTDLVLVFKSQRALDGLSSGKITLGGDASIAAGPVGRQASAATDLQMQSEIYSYARSRGFFAGVSLDGSVLSMDSDANGEYYQGERSAAKILTDTSIPAQASGRRFIDTLAAIAPALPGQGASRAAAADPEMTTPAPSGARTFGVEDGSAAPAEGGVF